MEFNGLPSNTMKKLFSVQNNCSTIVDHWYTIITMADMMVNPYRILQSLLDSMQQRILGVRFFVYDKIIDDHKVIII